MPQPCQCIEVHIYRQNSISTYTQTYLKDLTATTVFDDTPGGSDTSQPRKLEGAVCDRPFSVQDLSSGGEISETAYDVACLVSARRYL